MILVYNLFLVMYSTGIRLVSFWNKKARLWIKGRKNYFENLRNTYKAGNQKKVWMHCSSLGEFEQGRPLLKKIIENNSDVSIVITFFSPSGYEIAKNDKDFKQVYYMPMDSASNAEKLLDVLKPDIILWVKYEYWQYYLKEIKKRQIPLLLISGVYQSNQVFFKWYGGFYRKMLESFTHFFVQNLSSKEQLQKLIAEEKISLSGDTRCDQVINIAENFTEVTGIANFCGDSKIIVTGSTWEDDEAQWTHFVKAHPEIKFIIAPHEIDDENLGDVQKEFPGSIFYSEWMEKTKNIKELKGSKAPPSEVFGEANCLIIDNIGMLSRLYHYATITYVGGGFGYNGLHNILEAAVYGKPVIFGPEYEKNFEAQELIDCSGAISIDNPLELEKLVITLLNNEENIASRGKAAKDYVYNNAGASQKIMDYIQKNRLFIN